MCNQGMLAALHRSVLTTLNWACWRYYLCLIPPCKWPFERQHLHWVFNKEINACVGLLLPVNHKIH